MGYDPNGTKWWKVWEYQVGVDIAIDDFRYTDSVGVGEVNCSIGTDKTTFDTKVGIYQTGVGVSHKEQNTTTYSRVYVRPLDIYVMYQLKSVSIAVKGFLAFIGI